MSAPVNGSHGRIGFPQATGASPYQPVAQFNQFSTPSPHLHSTPSQHVNGITPHGSTVIPQPQPHPFLPPPTVNGHAPQNPPASIATAPPATSSSAFKPYSPFQPGGQGITPSYGAPPHGQPPAPMPSSHQYSAAPMAQQFAHMSVSSPMPGAPSCGPPAATPSFAPPPPHSRIPQPSPAPPAAPLPPSYHPSPSLPTPTSAPPARQPGPPMGGMTPGYQGPQPAYGPPVPGTPVQGGYSQTGPAHRPPSSSGGGHAGYPQAAPGGYPQAGPGGYPQPTPGGQPFPGGNQQPSARALTDYVDLSTERNPILYGMPEVEFSMPQNVSAADVRCQPEIFRCTLNAIPQTEELLQKSRLPLGLTLQPFRDIKQLNVIRAPSIVRCRYCRTYINPFVHLPDNRRWKCNLCFKNNDLPDDFLYDPATKTFQDANRRPELQHATVEFIAPSEYMLRPPQPAVYLFIFDISVAAIQSGYLQSWSEQMLVNLDQMPGDDRTLISLIAVDSSLHYFQFFNENKLPRELVVNDLEDTFIPANSGFVVKLKQFKESVRMLMSRVSEMYFSPCQASAGNCLGSALLAAKELIGETGGRVTVFQCSIPSIGPGALKSRDDSNQRSAQDADVTPATDFYKRLSLECTAVQIGIDLFALNREFIDVATLSEMVKFSSGSLYRFANFDYVDQPRERKRFERMLTRYLTRKIGFEAVLRIRCSRGLSVSAFYGNFFVRSTDLLAMANVNPDSAVGVQLSYEERLGTATACFQAALLYTSSKGDRRIRVHTLCLPTTSELPPLFASVDVRAMLSLLGKLAGERAMGGSSLADCREAIVNASVDGLGAFSKTAGRTGLLAPRGGLLKMLPLMSLALLKQTAFGASRNITVDDRVSAMLALRSYPLEYILTDVYPMLFRLNDIPQMKKEEEGEKNEPQQLPLSYEQMSREGVFFMVAGYSLFVYVAASSDPSFVHDLFGMKYQLLDSESWKEQPNEVSRQVHAFVSSVIHRLHVMGTVTVIREDSPLRDLFVSRFVDDRTESTHSYVEFIQHIKKEIGH